MTSLTHCAETLKYPIYNIAARGNPTMLDVARLIRGFILDAKVMLGPSWPEKPEFKEMNLERIKEVLGFVSRELKEGITAFIDWLKEEKH